MRSDATYPSRSVMGSAFCPSDPASRPGPTETKAAQAAPQPVAPSHQIPFIPPSDRRLIDPTKNDVTRYSYKGGQTAVMTGGVMLGLGQPNSKNTATPSTPGRRTQNEGGARTALSRGKGSYNAGGVGRKSGHKRSDSADWRKPATE
ncbi:hypothetical protein AAF712_003910 [Marasmius tenuissimus]|uniref:Uncharacterized protein n=1 Tax=Marasmius tenuissimus TaxID=585030 RepID=A0ABR3A6A7_9AGAR